MNVTAPEKERRLRELFYRGTSTREAARLAGVSKGTAQRVRNKMGGLPVLRDMGVNFKQNRWK